MFYTLPPFKRKQRSAKSRSCAHGCQISPKAKCQIDYKEGQLRSNQRPKKGQTFTQLFLLLSFKGENKYIHM